LHSIGVSGSDSQLIKPLIFAAASLPRALKTRILRAGMQAPVLMWLMREALHGDHRSVKSHVPAFSLPVEAGRPAPNRELRDDGSLESLAEAYERVVAEPAPFLDALLEAANGLKHIPPVARIQHFASPTITGGDYSIEPYINSDPYSVHAVLRPGERLDLNFTLSQSWTDERFHTEYLVQLLRDPSTTQGTSIELSRIAEGETKISIPWQKTEAATGQRTDVLLQVNDGSMDSFPAYISVRHLQEEDRALFNF